MMTEIRTRRDRRTEGGARDNTRGLGCGTALVTGPVSTGPVVFSKLKTWTVALLASLVWAVPASADLVVPSGQQVSVLDILVEDQGGQPTLVIRLLTPDIARGGAALNYDAVEADFDAICGAVGLPVRALAGSTASHIIVVMMDRMLPRGTPDPEATQYISEFRVEDGRCMLEFF
jgi:hypothetical protein